MSKSLISLRVSVEEKTELERMAAREGMSLSAYLRRLMIKHLNSDTDEKKISMVDQTLLNSASQLLYISRMLADKVDEHAKDKAREYARTQVYNFITARANHE